MVEPLLNPRHGVSDLVLTESAFTEMISALDAGSGPIAIDAERASGYRYSQRAYLIQIFRRGGGLYLIDPIAMPDRNLWIALNDRFKDCEWIIHASTQDLPCLRELGINPEHLFDTELGARISGCERVGLGALSESLLELQLAKEHSAVDWSIRPLKQEWLIYAALDVDVLVDLRDAVEKLLIEANKLEWAQADFAQILKNPATPPRTDPWRRTSGLHKIKDRTSLAIVRELWSARDRYAQTIDVAPGRIFNDEILVDIAVKRPVTVDNFTRLIYKRTRLENLPTTEWFALYQTALTLDPTALPPLKVVATGLPNIKLWKDRNPVAHARLTHARAVVSQLAQQLNLPAENLISPEVIRQLAWQAPQADFLSDQELAHFITQTMTGYGARPWQVSEIADRILPALREVTPLVVEWPPEESSEIQQD
jgi:ribonuclease D